MNHANRAPSPNKHRQEAERDRGRVARRGRESRPRAHQPPRKEDT